MRSCPCSLSVSIFFILLPNDLLSATEAFAASVKSISEYKSLIEEINLPAQTVSSNENFPFEPAQRMIISCFNLIKRLATASKFANDTRKRFLANFDFTIASEPFVVKNIMDFPSTHVPPYA